MIDLGAWASETYRVPLAEMPEGEEPADDERLRGPRDHDPE
jgi:endogenous inhibitor of DNA gyrase (YacG/DUF329 family)